MQLLQFQEEVFGKHVSNAPLTKLPVSPRRGGQRAAGGGTGDGDAVGRGLRPGAG